jgi:hypothetical protein
MTQIYHLLSIAIVNIDLPFYIKYNIITKYRAEMYLKKI